QALERLVGATDDWGRLDEFLISYLVEPAMRATVLASSFATVLEMVREGALEVQQTGAFAPLYLRKRPGDPAPVSAVTAP
ncbi:MAG TPA: segregation/condensation protein A, partial [Roseiarcus sp.]|nr:segregation/condensation protein A [Roseiarcus sp.]